MNWALIFNSFLLRAVLIALPFYAIPQAGIFTQDFNCNTKIVDESANMMKLTCSYVDGTIFFTTLNQVNSDSRWIYNYNLVSKAKDSVEIKLNKQTKQLFGTRLFCMEVVKDKIILMNDAYVYIFGFNGKKCRFEYSVKLEKKFNYVYKLNDSELLLYVNYNFHPKSSIEKHVWAKLDLKTHSISPYKRMDESNNRFTSFNNQWLSVYKGLIAFSRTTEYKITLFDANFNASDSILSNQLEANKKYLSRLNQEYDYSRDQVILDMKMDDTCLTRIQKIFLLDSVHLLVMLKLPKSYKCKFDLWVKTKNGWELKKSETLSGFYEEGKKYTSTQQPVLGLFGNVNGICYKDHTFYFVYYPFMENIITDSFNKKSDYDTPTNNLVKKGELYYGIYKYKVSID